MNTKNFLIGFALLLGFGIGISIPISVAGEKSISLVADSITAVTGLGTIWLAYIIYRDLGYSKKISEKQFETVAEFLEELKGTVFQITGSDDKLTYQSSPSIGPTDSYLKKWLDFEISVDNDNYFGGLKKLFDLSNSIYMPHELRSKLIVISGLTFRSGLINERNRNVKITVNKLNSVSIPFMMYENDQPVKLNNFLNRIQQTLIVLKDWIEKHSKGKINV